MRACCTAFLSSSPWPRPSIPGRRRHSAAARHRAGADSARFSNPGFSPVARPPSGSKLLAGRVNWVSRGSATAAATDRGSAGTAAARDGARAAAGASEGPTVSPPGTPSGHARPHRHPSRRTSRQSAHEHLRQAGQSWNIWGTDWNIPVSGCTAAERLRHAADHLVHAAAGRADTSIPVLAYSAVARAAVVAVLVPVCSTTEPAIMAGPAGLAPMAAGGECSAAPSSTSSGRCRTRFRRMRSAPSTCRIPRSIRRSCRSGRPAPGVERDVIGAFDAVGVDDRRRISPARPRRTVRQRPTAR